jgi:hypothetical protein
LRQVREPVPDGSEVHVRSLRLPAGLHGVHDAGRCAIVHRFDDTGCGGLRHLR